MSKKGEPPVAPQQLILYGHKKEASSSTSPILLCN
jgi:hypothetical protein